MSGGAHHGGQRAIGLLNGNSHREPFAQLRDAADAEFDLGNRRRHQRRSRQRNEQGDQAEREPKRHRSIVPDEPPTGQLAA